MKNFDTIFFDFDRTVRLSHMYWEDFACDHLQGVGFTISTEKRQQTKRWTHYYFQSDELKRDRTRFTDEDGFWDHFYTQFIKQFTGSEEQAQTLMPVLRERVTNECFPRRDDYVPQKSLEALEHLHSQGYKMGIITNRSSSIDELLEQLGLTSFFPWVIVSGEVGITKPDTGIFHLALEQSQAEAHNTLYVGDNYYADVIGAQNAGLTPVLVDPEGLFPEAQCPVIASVADLPALLPALAI